MDENVKPVVVDKRKLNLSEKQQKRLDQERKRRRSASLDARNQTPPNREAAERVGKILQAAAEAAVQQALARDIGPLLDKVQAGMRQQFMAVAQGTNYAQAATLSLLRILVSKGLTDIEEFDEAVSLFESLDEHTNENVAAFVKGEAVSTKEETDGPEKETPDDSSREGAEDIRHEGGEGSGSGHALQHEEDRMSDVQPDGDSNA